MNNNKYIISKREGVYYFLDKNKENYIYSSNFLKLRSDNTSFYGIKIHKSYKW